MKTLAITAALITVVLCAGCNSKQAEDTAAIRAIMEKQAADEVAAKKRMEASDAAVRKSLGIAPKN